MKELEADNTRGEENSKGDGRRKTTTMYNEDVDRDKANRSLSQDSSLVVIKSRSNTPESFGVEITEERLEDDYADDEGNASGSDNEELTEIEHATILLSDDDQLVGKDNEYEDEREISVKKELDNSIKDALAEPLDEDHVSIIEIMPLKGVKLLRAKQEHFSVEDDERSTYMITPIPREEEDDEPSKIVESIQSPPKRKRGRPKGRKQFIEVMVDVGEDADDDSSNCCRVCMSKDSLVSIFSREDREVIANRLALICPSVKIERKDNLPQSICHQCVQSVTVACNLKILCEQTDAKLRSNLFSKRRTTIPKVGRPTIVKEELPPSPVPATVPAKRGRPRKRAVSETLSDPDWEKGLEMSKSYRRSGTRNSKSVIDTSIAIKSEDSVTYKMNRNLSLPPKKQVVEVPKKRGRPPGSGKKKRGRPRKVQPSNGDVELKLEAEDDKKSSSDEEIDESPLPKRRYLKMANKGMKEEVEQPETSMTTPTQFPCPDCDMVYASAISLRGHKKKHKNKGLVMSEKPHECPVCKKVFKFQGNYEAHIKRHKDDSLMCEKCDETFPSMMKRRKHMAEEHGVPEAQFVCKSCGKGFTTENRLSRHSEGKCRGSDSSGEQKGRKHGEVGRSGRNLFKCVAPLTTTYWSDSFSD